MIDLAAPPFTLLAERDMDLLVLEEMLSSDPFKKWLVSKLYNGTRQFRRMIGAWHTPSLEPLGSVDILFVFEEMSAGHKCAILIENKIDRVYAVGPDSGALFDILPEQMRGIKKPVSDELAAVIRSEITADDIVLVKGSFGSKMAKIVEALKNFH